MLFKNTQNGFMKDSPCPWLWTFLFGFFYFLYKGIWLHAAIMLVVAILAYVTDNTIISIVLLIGYTCVANKIVRHHYLSNGWVEVSDGTQVNTLD